MSISKDEYASIVSSFLQEIDLQFLPWEFTPGVREEVVEYFASKQWTQKQIKYAVNVAGALSSCAMYHPYASRKVQVATGILATFIGFMDDSKEYLGNSLDHFAINMLNGKPQEHPFMQAFVDFLSNDLKFMDPFTHSMFIQDCIDFAAGCVIERDHPSLIIRPGAINFAKYLREKSTFGEAFVYLSFSDYPSNKEQRHRYLPVIQDLRVFMGHSNDLLSFYKESMDGEDDFTYISNVAKAKELTIPDALRLVASDVVQNVRNIRKMLSNSDQEDILKTANDFINGFISWHLHLGRYRLDEVPLFDKNKNLMDLKLNESRGQNFVFKSE